MSTVILAITSAAKAILNAIDKSCAAKEVHSDYMAADILPPGVEGEVMLPYSFPKKTLICSKTLAVKRSI